MIVQRLILQLRLVYAVFRFLLSAPFPGLLFLSEYVLVPYEAFLLLPIVFVPLLHEVALLLFVVLLLFAELLLVVALLLFAALLPTRPVLGAKLLFFLLLPVPSAIFLLDVSVLLLQLPRLFAVPL